MWLHVASSHYQDVYFKEIKQAYEAAQYETDALKAIFVLSHYVNSQAKKEVFHHVLTKMAFLELRVESESNHGIVPFLLNGSEQSSFPKFIGNSTTIRIEEGTYREASDWKGQVTYQHQG